jgi:hypothetical protein
MERLLDGLDIFWIKSLLPAAPAIMRVPFDDLCQGAPGNRELAGRLIHEHVWQAGGHYPSTSRAQPETG